MTRLVLFELFVTNLLLFEHLQKKKLLVSWQFSGPYGVTKYGSGWRKDVVNQCLEFERDPHSQAVPHSSTTPGDHRLAEPDRGAGRLLRWCCPRKFLLRVRHDAELRQPRAAVQLWRQRQRLAPRRGRLDFQARLARHRLRGRRHR